MNSLYFFQFNKIIQDHILLRCIATQNGRTFTDRSAVTSYVPLIRLARDLTKQEKNTQHFLVLSNPFTYWLEWHGKFPGRILVHQPVEGGGTNERPCGFQGHIKSAEGFHYKQLTHLWTYDIKNWYKNWERGMSTVWYNRILTINIPPHGVWIRKKMWKVWSSAL